MLYIMRHGKTDWNAVRRLQGRTDIPLNEEGRRMAEEVRSECAEIGFDICYSSPLVRARETAETALRGLGVPIVYDDRLVEMSFGIYEGVADASSVEGSPIHKFFMEPENFHGTENGESFEDLFARTGEFIREVLRPALEEGKKVLVVGHGAMNCSIVCQIKNLPVSDFWKTGIPNCRLIRLE
ncbi:MAG: histidine phosphatase family protein [Oscillospiraceae bacterium]|nr:histidine phosphatase family protein [Oscillospiraceae bacterium]